MHVARRWGSSDRCGGYPCVFGKTSLSDRGLALLIPAIATQQPNRGRRGRVARLLLTKPIRSESKLILHILRP